ncbi:methylated-DNA--[protein]-cysteine S-methyltransferase [Calidifontibacter terrae]
MTDRPVSPEQTQQLFPASPEELAILHERLARLADEAGLLEVAYRTIDTPVGPLLLAATNRGLVRVAFECEGFDTVLHALAGRLGPRILQAPSRLDPVASEITDYFAGRRRSFDLPLDFSLSTGFRSVVQHYLPEIGYGTTQSYRDVAEHVGNPGAVRAVGTACATNPLPVVVPCHRVVRSDGTSGNYRGGPAAKAALLMLERAA